MDMTMLAVEIRNAKPNLSHTECESIARHLIGLGIEFRKQEPQEEAYDRIYKETQELAGMLAHFDGFSPIEGKTINHESTGRGKSWWNMAVEVQEFLNGHEMSDIIDEYVEMQEPELELGIYLNDRRMADCCVANKHEPYISISSYDKEDMHFLYDLVGPTPDVEEVHNLIVCQPETIHHYRVRLQGHNMLDNEFNFKIVDQTIEERK